MPGNNARKEKRDVHNSMSQARVPVLTQICAPVPHSTFIQTITECAKNTWCNESYNGQKMVDFYVNNAELNADESETNSNNKQGMESGEIQDSLFAILDSADRSIDEDVLMELACDLGLTNEQIELPDLKSVSEASILSWLR